MRVSFWNFYPVKYVSVKVAIGINTFKKAIRDVKTPVFQKYLVNCVEKR